MHGLNDEEVLESRQKFGDNKIIEAEPETFLDKFKDAFGDPMIKLLLAIACIMAIMAFRLCWMGRAYRNSYFCIISYRYIS